MTVTFQEERYADIEQELPPLYAMHYAEIAEHQDAVELDMDFEGYRKLDEGGALILITVRNDGKLVGYYKAVITPNLHYKSTKTAWTDIYYIDPSIRGQGNGLRLIRAAVEAVKKRGVKRFYAGVKLKHDVGPLFEKVGFGPIERGYDIILEY